MRVAPVVVFGLALFAAGYWFRGWQSEPARRALQDLAAQSRLAAQHADAHRAAAQAAFDAERAELAARVTSLQQRARTLGSAASHLVDTVAAEAPDTCLPGLQRLRFAWTLHLEADVASDAAVRGLLAKDSLEIAAERMRTAAVAAQRDTAQNRLDRALAALLSLPLD